MEVDTVLVPVDASEEALVAAEYGGAIGREYGATVHVLHLLDEEAGWALEAGHLDEADVADQHEAFMDDVREVIPEDVDVTHSAAFGFTQSELSRHPGSVILDAAEDVGADFLVVPREPITGEPGEVLGKAAQYVLAYASQPVLSV